MTIWGISFSVVKIGLAELPPILFIALRFLIVAIPAVFIVPFPKTSIWNVVSVGILLGIIKFGLLFIAMRSDANAGVSSLILQAQVLFTIALSYVFFQEKPKVNQVFGITIAATGFLFFLTAAGENITYLGLILILLAALAWALSNLIMKKFHDVNLFNFIVWVSLVPPLPLLFISYVTETHEPISLMTNLAPSAWFAIFYMGYLSTLVAYAIWGRLLKKYPAATVTPFALLIPVIGIMTSSIWLKETLSFLESIGAIIVMIGLILCVFGDSWISAARNVLTRLKRDISLHQIDCDN